MIIGVVVTDNREDQIGAAIDSVLGQVDKILIVDTGVTDSTIKQAEKTDGRIAALSQAAGRIGDVVKLITAIAEQTNLLALNATI